MSFGRLAIGLCFLVAGASLAQSPKESRPDPTSAPIRPSCAERTNPETLTRRRGQLGTSSEKKGRAKVMFQA